jgi:superfamily II DNA or RNA helicase
VDVNIVLKVKNNAYLQVDSDDAGIMHELSEFFTFFVPGYKFMPAFRNKMWDGKMRLLDMRSRTIYVGLYNYIKEFANERGYNLTVDVDSQHYTRPDVDYDDNVDWIDSLPLTAAGKKITPRDYQKEAVAYALKHRRGLLISPTASGKSLIIYLLIRYFLEYNKGKKVLLVVPTTSLVKQMAGDFEDYSTLDETFNVDRCHQIMAGVDKNDEDKDIYVSTWQSIYKMPASYFQQFGMVVGDEAHNFKAKSLTSILSKCTEAGYRFGLTGTLDGTQTHKLVLEGLFGPVKNVTTTKALMDDGSLSDATISVILLKHPQEMCKALKKAKYPEEMQYIVSYAPRNRFIKNLALDQKGNTLVLFQYVEKHGVPLHKMIQEEASTDREVFFVSGNTDAETREDIRKITETKHDAIIVASLGTFSTGINIRNLHNIIFASPSKSQIKILQSIGRALRKSDNGEAAKIFDIADDLSWKSHKNYTLNHSAERIKIYAKQKFKFSIHQIDI